MTIRENLQELIRLVTEQPEQLLDLSRFRNETECGTIYCVAGLACTSAHFRSLGWYWCHSFGDYPSIGKGRHIGEDPVLDEQCGPWAWDYIFCVRKLGETGTDKEIALKRLNEQLERIEK